MADKKYVYLSISCQCKKLDLVWSFHPVMLHPEKRFKFPMNLNTPISNITVQYISSQSQLLSLVQFVFLHFNLLGWKKFWQVLKLSILYNGLLWKEKLLSWACQFCFVVSNKIERWNLFKFTELTFDLNLLNWRMHISNVHIKS